MNRNKGIIISGLLAFGSLFILSVIYYKERIIFLDPVFQLAYMIRDGGFAIQVNRFAAVITKIFPYLAIKLSLPLNIITLIYSMSFVLYNFIIFIVIAKFIKNLKWALFLLLFNILMISHTFYWPAIELNQGIAIMILYFSLLNKELKINKNILLIFFIILVPTVIFSHPLIIIPFVFLSFYLYFFEKGQYDLLLFRIGSAMALISFIINKIFFRNWYDDMNMTRLDNFIKLFPDYFHIKSNSEFFSYVIHDYYISLILLMVVVIWFILKKKYLQLSYVLVFVLSYVLLVNISFPEGVPHFFAESKYILLSIFIIMPLVYDIFPKVPFKTTFWILIFVIIVRVIHINNSHSLYTARLDILRNVIDETENFENKKLILYQDEFPMDTLLMSWAS
ncbi:MAG TPA: hypothetical protein ENI82_00335, partial [Bacteroidetes bacterium]|nr:hypothetical protein [Bacteroidota bacterium]